MGAEKERTHQSILEARAKATQRTTTTTTPPGKQHVNVRYIEALCNASLLVQEDTCLCKRAFSLSPCTQCSKRFRIVCCVTDGERWSEHDNGMRIENREETVLLLKSCFLVDEGWKAGRTNLAAR